MRSQPLTLSAPQIHATSTTANQVKGNTWGRGDTRDLWFDPPLTSRGASHAGATAQAFKDQVFKGSSGKDGGLDAIYVSPLVRAAQTAAEFSKVLNVPLKVVPGLSTCAAAVVEERGLIRDSHGNLRLRRSNLPFRSMDQLRGMCEGAEILDTNPEEEISQDFCQQIRELCEKELKGSTPEQPRLHRVMVVAHREGVRDVSQISQGATIRSTPYCCVAVYRYRKPSGGEGPGIFECKGCADLVPFTCSKPLS